MTISDQVPDSDAMFLRRGEGALAVVFVHGFLDDQHVWDKVIDELKTPGIETIRLDLAGLGDRGDAGGPFSYERLADEVGAVDRKSTRLNSSHSQISYAVFCLKKKKKKDGR